MWSIIGGGAFPITYPNVVTNMHRKLPMINVVFTNPEYAFIKNRYENANKSLFGTDLTDVGYAQVSEVQGAKGLAASRIEDTDQVM